MGSLYMGGDENLVYWLDYRSGSLTYGQKITSNFGSEPINNGLSMCMDPNQSETKIVKNDSNLLLGYLNNQADQLASYQILDLNLDPINGDLGIQVESTSDYQPYFDTVVDEYGNFYYGYSKQLDFGPYYNDIFLQKFDSNGNPLWSTPIQVTERWGEDNVKSIHPLSGGGCILIYEAGSFTGISLKSIAVDGDGNIAEGWENGPIDLTNVSNIFQYYEDSFHTNNYVFVSWKDTRGNGYDVYGQFLGMDGSILGNAEGIVVAGYPNDQDNSTAALNSSGNEILVCWEDNQFGDDTDILCSSISTSDHSIGELIYVANSNDEEMSPYLFPAETGSYLITWENRVGGLDSDIFYQEINNGVGVHDENGLSVCDVPFDQTNPKIGLYSESSNAYIIYWDDKRSTGKAELTNIFCQSVTIDSEQGLMISFLNDWNIVGLPLIPPDVYYTEVFPDAIPGTMYSFNGSYSPSQELILGEGYWLRFNESGTTTLTGTIVEEYTRELMEDWNLISVLDQPMDVEQIGDPENIIIPGTIYGFSEAYEPTSLLVPGKGYWIRTTQAGEITFYSNPTNQRISQTFENDGSNTLEINGVTLYFGIPNHESKKLQYSLPPKPPTGAFDVRFSGGWTYPEESNIIEVMHKGLPLNLSYNIKESNEKNEKWKIVNLETNETFRLSVGTGEILLPPANQYRLEKWDSAIPEAFSLSQNFPNPFNPKTNIMFDVPVESHINVTVFDVTGRMVKILMDDVKNPGSHIVSWNGLDVNKQILPSGVYLYSIKAGQFHDVKKMIFVK